MGSSKRFDNHHDKPHGPNGGNFIDLSRMPEGEAVLQTVAELGGFAIGGTSSDVNEQMLLAKAPEPPTLDPAIYKKDPFQ